MAGSDSAVRKSCCTNQELARSMRNELSPSFLNTTPGVHFRASFSLHAVKQAHTLLLAWVFVIPAGIICASLTTLGNWPQEKFICRVATATMCGSSVMLNHACNPTGCTSYM